MPLRSRVLWVLLALLLALSATACPARRPSATDDPGPPTVLDPSLLDRG